jgi:hypothetical protein
LSVYLPLAISLNGAVITSRSGVSSENSRVCAAAGSATIQPIAASSPIHRAPPISPSPCPAQSWHAATGA